jgi:hypothetical protein
VPVGGDVDVSVGGDVEGQADDLPDALERVTRLGLRKLEKVLREPLDPTDASRTRNQITAAIGAVNAQLRADEQRLRAKVRGDVLERLVKIIAEEKAKREARRTLLSKAGSVAGAEGGAASPVSGAEPGGRGESTEGEEWESP